ncbi:MAG: hypothetical protein LBU97_02380 [Alistipes sp.]|jgi:hypothetical protein|nr:hypothetical protein [Alistipes sp.]
MKRILLLAAVAALSFGCDRGPTGFPIPEYPEPTLAQSVSLGRYAAEGEWSFDGVTRELSRSLVQNNMVTIRARGGSDISFECAIMPDEDLQEDMLRYSFPPQMIRIDDIYLSGEPYDVTFSESSRGQVTYWERTSLTSSIVCASESTLVEGWIKRDYGLNTRTTIAPRWYLCDIKIECEFDGKPFRLHITRMIPW